MINNPRPYHNNIQYALDSKLVVAHASGLRSLSDVQSRQLLFDLWMPADTSIYEIGLGTQVENRDAVWYWFGQLAKHNRSAIFVYFGRSVPPEWTHAAYWSMELIDGDWYVTKNRMDWTGYSPTKIFGDGLLSDIST